MRAISCPFHNYPARHRYHRQRSLCEPGTSTGYCCCCCCSCCCRDMDPIPNEPSSYCRRFVPRCRMNECARDWLSKILVSVVKLRTKYISSANLLAHWMKHQIQNNTDPKTDHFAYWSIGQDEIFPVHLFSHHRPLIRLRSLTLPATRNTHCSARRKYHKIKAANISLSQTFLTD